MTSIDNVIGVNKTFISMARLPAIENAPGFLNPLHKAHPEIAGSLVMRTRTRIPSKADSQKKEEKTIMPETMQEPPQPEQPSEPQPAQPPTPTQPPAPPQPTTPPEYPGTPPQPPATPPPVEIPGEPVTEPGPTPVEIPPAPGEFPNRPDPDSPLPVTNPPMARQNGSSISCRNNSESSPIFIIL